VKANKGSPGIDGMRVEELPGYVKQHWLAIREQLLSGTYQPQRVCQFLCVNDHGSVVGVEVEVGVVFGDGVAGEGGISPSLASPRRKELWCIMPTCPAWACARATGW
jgi:hypothetical protein